VPSLINDYPDVVEFSNSIWNRASIQSWVNQDRSQYKRAVIHYGQVIKSYEKVYSSPIHIEPGERISFEERESEWDGWLWCKKSEGDSGWVPLSDLELTNGSATALRSYSAMELSVKTGDSVQIERRESGWVWCRDKDGRSGWVPEENISL
jgi:uncharacterized protein YgiM (DUF1202 family)